jgi:hypothetical protein
MMLLMKHVIYSMQFKGTAVPSSEGVLKATTSATSCSIESVIGPDGIEGRFHPAEGGLAWFESEVRLSGPHSFTETGEISFGEEDHSLRFSTVGEGHMGPTADARYSAGAVTWKVEGGEGQFEGASGYITSNFLITEAGEVTDYQFGVIFLK